MTTLTIDLDNLSALSGIIVFSLSVLNKRKNKKQTENSNI